MGYIPKEHIFFLIHYLLRTILVDCSVLQEEILENGRNSFEVNSAY